MRWLWAFLLVLLVGCVSTAEREQLSAEVTSLKSELATAELELVRLNDSLRATRSDLASAQAKVNQAAVDITKYDRLYEQKVQEVRVLESQLDSCTTELARYKPKVSVSTSYDSIPYDDLMRNSDAYVGAKVRYRGEVLQVAQRDDGTFALRIAITEDDYFWTDPIWVEYGGARVLEDDLVMLYGTFDGLTTYTAVLGNEITIPKIRADKITVLIKAGDR